MARILGIDWDNSQLHVVAATIGRGGVRIDAAVVLQGDFTPTFAQADLIGGRLKEQLKAAGIAPAPVVICIGRDRVIAKEIRYPQVPLAEEPAIIRFQAAKELTEAGEGVVIDYTAKGDGPQAAGERTALAFAIRKDLPVFFEKVCKAANLGRLLAVTPRSFGVASCLKRAAAAPEPGAAIAVLTVAESWADFAVVRGDGVLFTRGLTGTAHLIAEVRRNLAVYAGQLPATAPARDKVHGVYVAGDGEHALLREQLQHTLTVPVHPLDPFSREAQLQPTAPRGGFAAAVGLVELWARNKAAPVNFIRPKEPIKTRDPEQQRTVRVAIGGVAVLVLLAVVCYLVLSWKRGEVEDLRAEASRLEADRVRLDPDKKHIDALKDWTGAAVPWLDELYEVTAKFEWRDGFHLTEFNASARQQGLNRGPLAAAKNKAPDKFAGLLTLIGEARPPDERLFDRLTGKLNDPMHFAKLDNTVNAQGTGSFNAKKEVRRATMKVDVVGQPSSRYTTLFVAQPSATLGRQLQAAVNNTEPDPDEGDDQ
ncbi:MAG TPA: hypothetical protein VEL76_41670 [Gemmataceae bacterium]|nr:hypothetical protein [Gemmataceae bacterium]